VTDFFNYIWWRWRELNPITLNAITRYQIWL